MMRLAAWAKTLPLALGGPGVFLVAFIDGSFLTLPELNDVLVVAAAALYPGALAYYATLLTIGSTAGTYVIFALARKGGEVFIHRRVDPARRASIRRFFDRFGFFAVLVGAILPAPMPFKLLVVIAATAPMAAVPFVAAVAAGRAIRYFGEGLLALWFGDQVLAVIRTNGVPLAAAGVLAAAAGSFLYWRLRARRQVRAL